MRRGKTELLILLFLAEPPSPIAVIRESSQESMFIQQLSPDKKPKAEK
jgi:hypothetical protein